MLPETVTKWFAPAALDVASYDTELKMEIKLWTLRNISRRLCEEVTAPKGDEAHTFGPTVLAYCLDNVRSSTFHGPIGLYGLLQG
jgi:hypothetical protein